MLLGGFAYWKSADIAKHKVIDGTANALKQNELRLEQLLKTVDNTTTQFATSPLIYEAKDKQLVYSQFQLFDSLRVGMHNLQTFDNGIQDVMLVNLKNDWLVSNDLMKPFQQTDNTDAILQHISMPLASQWIKETENDRLIPGSSFQEGVNLVKKIPINSADPWGLLITKIPANELKKSLFLSNPAERILILDERDRVVVDSSTSGEGLEALLIGVNGVLQPTQLQSGFETVEIAHSQIGVTYQKSAYNAWTYLSLIPVQEITKDSRVIGWITLLICLLLVAIVLLISFMASFGMYAPIRTLYNSAAKLDESPPESNDSKDEFQYIGERLHRYQKTQLRMEDERKRYLQQVKELFVMHLCQGKLSKRDIDESDLSADFMLQAELRVLSLRVDTFEGTPYREQDRQLLLFAVSNIVGELVPPYRRLSPVVIDQYQICVIGSDRNDPETAKSELLQLAEHVQLTIMEVLSLKTSIGISRPYQTLEGTSNAYDESLEALQYTLMIGQESVLFIDDVRPHGQSQQAFPDRMESELIDAVKLGDADKACGLLSRFMNEISSPPIDIRTYQLSLLRLFADLIRLMETQTESGFEQAIDAKTSLAQIFELKTKKETEQWFRELLRTIIAMFESGRESQFKNISERIVAMIHEFYHTDLTLEVCSKRLNYHANYLKRVFRTETGTNFSEYLIQYRMSMAKKWLIETDLKISEIAEKAGYKIPQNFIRIFRKAEGLTPGQYREQYAHTGNTRVE